MKLIDNDPEYRELMLGADILSSASNSYWETLTVLQLGVTPTEWQQLPLNTRGKYVAALKLKNMSELLERHVSEQNRRKREKGIDPQNPTNAFRGLKSK